MLWRAAARGPAGLQPNTTFEELSKIHRVHPDVKSAPLFAYRGVMSVGVLCSPKATWVMGGSKCPTRLVGKLHGAATSFLSAKRNAAVLFVFSRF